MHPGDAICAAIFAPGTANILPSPVASESPHGYPAPAGAEAAGHTSSAAGGTVAHLYLQGRREGVVAGPGEPEGASHRRPSRSGALQRPLQMEGSIDLQ